MDATATNRHLSDIFRGLEARGLVVLTTRECGVWTVAHPVIAIGIRRLTVVDVGGVPWIAWIRATDAAREPICPVIDQYTAVLRIGAALDITSGSSPGEST